MKTLTARADFLRLARGRKAALPGLLLQASPTPPEHIPAKPLLAKSGLAKSGAFLRVGYTASRKVGIAVVRNRAKRRLREAARALLPRLGRPFHDYVLIGRAETVNRPFALILTDLETALKRVHGGASNEQGPAS
jgi:ribonuclease P protein component